MLATSIFIIFFEVPHLGERYTDKRDYTDKYLPVEGIRILGD
jgi:hypothetical protein